jgi:riboflavin synthase
MFTGLVQAKGWIESRIGGRLVVGVQRAWEGDPMTLGESIAVNGCCLTVVGMEGGMAFDLSEETFARTSLGDLQKGSEVNLERAMKMGDRLGGHIVQGHVDGVGTCLGIDERDGSWTFHFAAPGGGKYLIDKGSVAVEGISLTVVEPQGDEFTVAVIPHTFAVTSLGSMAPGQKVNIEYDVLAKHVEKLLESRLAP